MKAVVMAGGEGTRLRPLTCDRPKPMVPIANRPVMEHIINLLRKHGFDEIYVTLYYLPDVITEYFGDGSSFGVSIEYSVEETPLGTAGSVRQLIDKIDDTFIVISGDALTDINLTEAFQFHKDKKSMATLVLTEVTEPLEYGVVVTDEDHKIRRFIEKPRWGEVISNLVNTGIYILEPEILKPYQAGLNFDFSKDLFPALLAKKAPLYGYHASGYWCDVGNLHAYLEANQDALHKKVSLEMPGQEISPGIWIEKGTVIHPEARLASPLILGKNVELKKGVELSQGVVIGDNIVVEENGSIKRSVLWNNCYLENKAVLRGAILGKNCYLKAKTNIYEGAVLGDNCVLEGENTVKPGKRIWPHKIIESGSIVSEDIIWGNKWGSTRFTMGGVSGAINVELTPEFASKLGTAFGSMLERQNLVVIGHDGCRASQMIAGSLISGLIASGIETQQIEKITLPVVKYLVQATQAQAGVHVRVSSVDKNYLDIRFIGKRGVEIDNKSIKKFENIMNREEFRRVSGDELGRTQNMSSAINLYQRAVESNFFAQNSPLKRRFKIVIDYGYGLCANISSGILSGRGVEIFGVNAYPDEKFMARTPEEFKQAVDQMKILVPSLQADFGVLMDSSGERLFLVDENGAYIEQLALIRFYIHHLLSRFPGKTVVLPNILPQELVHEVQNMQGRVISTKSNLEAIVAACQNTRDVIFAADGNGGYIFPAIFTGFDALLTLIMLLDVLTLEGGRLSLLLKKLTPIHYLQNSILCPWQVKGKIMKVMSQKYPAQGSEIEGVKLKGPNQSCITILPDAEKPLVHLYSEASTSREARMLIKKYYKEIETIKKTS